MAALVPDLACFVLTSSKQPILSEKVLPSSGVFTTDGAKLKTETSSNVSAKGHQYLVALSTTAQVTRTLGFARAANPVSD